MSQYGARGRALAGEDAPTILAHYYEAPCWDRSIRIPYPGPCPVEVAGHRIGTPADLRPPVDLDDRRDLRGLPGRGGAPGHPDRRPASPTTWRIRVVAKDGTVLLDLPKPADLVVRPTSGAGRLQLASKPTPPTIEIPAPSE